MKCLFLVLAIMCSSLFNFVSADSLVEQIDREYNSLNKTKYCEQMLAYYKQTQWNLYQTVKNGNDIEIAKKFISEYEDKDSILASSVAKFHRQSSFADSTYYAELIADFEKVIKLPNPYFVLKIKLINNQFYVDTTSFKFDLYWLSENLGDCNCIFIESEYGNKIHVCANCYPANGSVKLIKRKIKHILKMEPKYLMCLCLDEFSSVLIYMLNDKIYVFSPSKKRDYELEYFIKNLYNK